MNILIYCVFMFILGITQMSSNIYLLRQISNNNTNAKSVNKLYRK